MEGWQELPLDAIIGGPLHLILTQLILEKKE
jgi:hypothetical protein